ncbi:MAG: hypothetical protein U9O98_04685 [Asgard group archaeon]|nr:hypothetical protein [Asgard group archaeon]
MAEKKLIICSNCGKKVPESKYCPNCGALLQASPTQELANQIQRVKEAHEMLSEFYEKTAQTFAENIKNQLDILIKRLKVLLQRLQFQKDQLEEEEKESNQIICLTCGEKVPLKNYCKICGKPLPQTKSEEEIEISRYLKETQNALLKLQKRIEPIISEEAIIELKGVSQLIHQLIRRYEIKTKKEPEIALKEEPEKIPEKKEKAPKVLPEKIKDETFWSNLERNLLNYWFFYLAIILFSVGICVTIYYIVITIESPAMQIGIIMGIGGGIVLIGEGLGLFHLMQAKSKKSNETTKNEKSKKAKLSQDKSPARKGNFLPQLVSILLFIGFTIVFVGSVLGMAAELAIPTGLFYYLGYAISCIAIALGVLNKTNLVSILGFLQLIILTSVELLWEQTADILSESLSLVMYLIPIVLIIVLGIFFKKWMSSIGVISVLSIMLCIPRIHQNVGLEILILFFLPIMMAVVLHFNSENIPLPFKRSMAIFSMFFPAVTLISLTFTSRFVTTVEPIWGQFYPFEIFLGSLSILLVAFYYPFIQEDKLAIKSENMILKIIGEIIIGIVAIVSVGVYRDTTTTLLFFLLYFALGIASSLKILQKNLSIFDQIISLAISEILAIVLIILVKVQTISDEIFLFIIGISYILVTYLGLVLPKIFHKPNLLFIIWSIVSGINVIFLGHITALNHWYIFTALLLLLGLSLISNIPIILQKEMWRKLSIATLLMNTITLSIFAFTRRIIAWPEYAAFQYEALVIFILFFIVSAPAFFSWHDKTEGIVNE